MTAQTVTSPVAVSSTREDDDLMHLVCCHSDDLALCGADVSDSEWVEDGAVCVVCSELEMFEDALPGDADCVCPCCEAIPQEQAS